MNKLYAICWMNDLKTHWENHNTNAILDLFKYVKEYFEGPFSNPVFCKEDIFDLWKEIDYQIIDNLDMDLFAYEEGNCAIHWYLKYKDNRDGNMYEMDGVYEVHFNEEGNCIFFKQWWVMAY